MRFGAKYFRFKVLLETGSASGCWLPYVSMKPPRNAVSSGESAVALKSPATMLAMPSEVAAMYWSRSATCCARIGAALVGPVQVGDVDIQRAPFQVDAQQSRRAAVVQRAQALFAAQQDRDGG